MCSDGEGGAQGTTGCWERTPAPGGGGARPKNHLAKPPTRVLQSTAGSTTTQSGQWVGRGEGWGGKGRVGGAGGQKVGVTTSCGEKRNYGKFDLIKVTVELLTGYETVLFNADVRP